jgi:hypothetical protein
MEGLRTMSATKESSMKKLMLSALAVASLWAGGAFAQSAEELAGSAWRPPVYNGQIPGTPEYYGNSGWPPLQQQPYVYGNRYYVPYATVPAYPYVPYARTRSDRDGDGIPNRRDRYPDDPSRY